MPGELPLDLTFLATGTWQHVFVNARSEDDAFVYKIASAFGDILPFDHPCRWRSPRRPVRALERVAIRLPSADRVIATYVRRASARNFAAMLELVDYILSQPLSAVLLPCQVIRDGRATLRLDDVVRSFEGPLLRQRRADYLFEKTEYPPSFDWRELVDAHHRLWRRGVTFSTATALLGLNSWGLLNGHVRLCDTSSLTTDARHTREILGDEHLDRREASLRRNKRDDAAAYVRFIRTEINRTTFERLWRADVDATA